MGAGHTKREVDSQPECWERAARVAAGAKGLPEQGERVVIVGCGTSYFIAQSYAALREAAGLGETDAFAASEFRTGRRYDRIVALTRSGTTTEVLDLLGHLPDGVPTVAITADPTSPVMRLARDTVVLDFADERSVVQTRFATSALVLLRAHLGADVSGLPDQARAALAAPLPEAAIDRRQYTFLGRGWTVGIAQEAALKLREATQSWTEAYPAMEYRHGPICIAQPDSLVWILDTPPAGLLEDLALTGTVTEVGTLDPLAELVRVHQLTVAVAHHKGLDPDQPRNLTRSVILDATS